MMVNNSLNNININKLNTDRLSTQMTTQKKIQRPSEDPIIAIRALRFRSQLSELNQYLEKNIPDARNWMSTTEDALIGVRDMLSNMQQYLVQGANGPLKEEDCKTIVENLKGFRDQIFENANADYAGRRIFSGYKTDTDMTFRYDEPDIDYTITEKLSSTSFDKVTKMSNSVEITDPPAKVNPADMPESYDVYRIRLSYEKLNGDPTKVSFTDDTGAAVTSPDVIVVKARPDGTMVDESNNPVDPYKPGDDEVYFLSDSGEMIFGKDAYATIKGDMNTGKTYNITYNKVGFDKGDLRPEHYFDCTKVETDGTTTTTNYNNSAQEISYTVNFNQKLKVNSEGQYIFTHKIVRDLDELVDRVEQVNALQKKVNEIEGMMDDPKYVNKKDELQSMLDAAKKEYDLANEAMTTQFESSITFFQGHQDRIDEEIADIGTRTNRLKLNEDRLKTQQTSLEELKSSNEDVNLPETVIKLTAAEQVLDASMAAASKIITKSLLDYL